MRWLLVRGWAREARHWGSFPTELGKALQARVDTVDLPGAGTRWRERSPTTVTGIVDALRRKGASNADPVHLFGLSLGGMVCAQWASRYPEEVAGCVLVNTSMRPFCAFTRRLRPRNYAAIARLALAERDVHRREAAILALTTTRAHDGVASTWARFAQEHPAARANVLRQLIAAARFRAPEVRPRSPLLVLASRNDSLVDPHCSEALACGWNAPMVVNAHGGHDLPLDDPGWVIARLQEWLRTLA
jgi:pimeloyl-ACP methyl ester carboxylesterase